MHIGEKIKELMESDSKFNPTNFALALGKKNKQTYYDMVKREDINTADLQLVAKYFGTSLSVFFDEEHKTKRKFIEERLEILEKKLHEIELKISALQKL
jgi:lipase chaperone LimK